MNKMAVFGEYLQKMTDSARRFKITVKHILMTDYFTKSSEEFNKIGYKCWVWLEISVFADFWLIFTKTD